MCLCARPLFPKGFTNEVQIIATVMSIDPEIDPDIVAMIGASAALQLSGIPFLGPIGAARILRNTLTKRLTIRGFIVHDFPPGDFLTDVSGWLRDGRISYREDIRDGLEQAPEAFIGLLEGENFGKLAIRASPEP